MRVWIGYDHREDPAFDVASLTACKFGNDVIPLYEDRLRVSGLLTRPTDRRGQMWDLNSNAPQSTEFAISRFFVPMLAHAGWALFTDCDVVFLRDPDELLNLANPSKAVMVVKHPWLNVGGVKMDGQMQTAYHRKNWSSVMLVNADHPANKRLNLTTLNQAPGRDLHAFSWLHDDEIGELPREWNWLVALQDKPANPAIAHFTNGGPFTEGWPGGPHDDIWHNALEGIAA
jgi:lipopolysaccharide biosynthesis glycosyltransferase